VIDIFDKSLQALEIALVKGHTVPLLWCTQLCYCVPITDDVKAKNWAKN